MTIYTNNAEGLTAAMAEVGGDVLRIWIDGARIITTPAVTIITGSREDAGYLSPSGSDDAQEIISAADQNGGTVYLGPGTFRIIANIRRSTPLRVIGSGMWRTTVLCSHNQNGALLVDPGSNSGVIDGCYFSDMTLDGQVETLGFSEHRHLISLHGTRNAIIERVRMRGFRGDGVYLGSGPDGGQSRHNYRATVRDCIFDGGDSNNRNGISIIDCDGALISNNLIKNCSRADMPGGIDIEPNIAANVVRNIRIELNTFENIGGVAACGLWISSYVMDVRPSGIRVRDNDFKNCRTAMSFDYVLQGPGYGGVLEVMDITASGNKVIDCEIPFIVRSSHSVTIGYNHFYNCKKEAQVGWPDSGAIALYARVVGNTFQRCGYDPDSAAYGAGLVISNSEMAKIMDNHFIDCGTGTSGLKNAIVLMAGTSNGIVLSGNEFLSPARLMNVAVLKKTDHTYTDPARNVDINNIKNGMAWGL